MNPLVLWFGAIGAFVGWHLTNSKSRANVDNDKPAVSPPKGEVGGAESPKTPNGVPVVVDIPGDVATPETPPDDK